MKTAKDNKMVTETLDIVTAGVVKYMLQAGRTLSAAESCTGGLICEKITSVAGASGMFCGGVCSYTEEVKMNVLGVSKDTLDKFTVYSAETASEMSRGALKLFGSDMAIGVTGIAGPDGGSDEKPVGTVYVSVRDKQNEIVRNLKLYERYDDLTRDKVRLICAKEALEMLTELFDKRGR